VATAARGRKIGTEVVQMLAERNRDRRLFAYSQDGTVTLVSVGAWKDRWGEHRNGVVQGPPLVRHERGMEVWM